MLLWLKYYSYMYFCFILSSRPLEDELFAVVSEPKRPALESSISTQAPNASAASKETSTCSDRVPAATSQTPPGSSADLFVERSGHRVSHAVQEQPQSRKRKEMEAEIKMDELESIMSEDMDCFDEQPSDNRGQRAQPIMHSSAGEKQGINTSSSSKRQRVHPEENVTDRKPQTGPKKEPGYQKNHSEKSEQHIVSIKTEEVDPFEHRTPYQESNKRPQVSSASTSKNIEPFDDDEASFIEVRTYCQCVSVVLFIQ